MAFDVFISYSAKEQPVAENLCGMIENAGISCWMAPRNVVPGSHWAASIAQAVRNARLLVLLFSENASISTQVAREVALADNYRLAILPIKIDDALPKNVLEYYLSVCHWLDISKQKIEDAESEIVSAARRYLGLKTGNVLLEDAMLDIYDNEMNQIGTAKRNGVHSEGLWHKTMHCWFLSKYGDEPCVWFQKRSGIKSDFPSLFDITAGRHLLADESDREATAKINIELGETVSFSDMHYIGVRVYSEKIEKFYNREFNSVYLFDCGNRLEEAVPNPKEVSGVVRLNAASALRLFNNEISRIQGEYYSNNEKQAITVAPVDFVPRSDDYYQKICRLTIDFFSKGSGLSL